MVGLVVDTGCEETEKKNRNAGDPYMMYAFRIYPYLYQTASVLFFPQSP